MKQVANMPFETEILEFKEYMADSLYKAVVAFANTDGGTILLGVNKAGEAAPIADTDALYTQVTNGIRDAVLPDVTIFTKYAIDSNGTIRIHIGEGAYKPYYLKSKGLKPSGVYVRQGASSVQASPDQIRQMIKNADGDKFEELRSMEQDLTFIACKKTFNERGIGFSEDKFNILKIHNRSRGLFTNLGLLLSDQCPHTIKAAVFSDGQNTVFRDRKEFAGSVIKQLEDAYNYLQLCNQNRSVINGLARTDYWDYPDYAIRESLINSLIHRDYSYSGSIIININEGHMEFISIGGLPQGLSPEDIMNGISQPRNQNLADAFHRLGYIESYGTGIRRIYSLYEGHGTQPAISVTPNSFKITLPNMNYSVTYPQNQPAPHLAIRETAAPAEQAAQTARHAAKPAVTRQMRRFLDCISENPDITDAGLQSALDIKRTRLYTLINQMEAAGCISIYGRGKNKKYTPVPGKARR